MPAQIMIVNADARLGLPLRLLLEGQGHVVAEAPDGAAALVRLEQARPDLILVNVSPPATGGYDLCQALREHPEWRRIRLLLIGSDAGEIVAAQARALGADAYLELPLRNARLCETVRALLGGAAP